MEEQEQEQEEEEGADPEVLCVGVVRMEEKEQEITGEEGGSKGRGGQPIAIWLTTQRRN